MYGSWSLTTVCVYFDKSNVHIPIYPLDNLKAGKFYNDNNRLHTHC